PFLPDEERERLKRRLAPPRVLDEKSIPQSMLPAERSMASVGVVISNWLGWGLLRPFRVPVDVTCGHSAGEVTALCDADRLDFEKHVRPRLWEGLAINPRWMTRGCLAFVSLTEEQLQPYLQGLSESQIAIYVAPDSQLVGGSFEEIDLLMARLRKDGVIAQRLPFVPGHTARMSSLRDELLPLSSMPDDSPPAKPHPVAFSSLTAHPYPTDPQGMRELLMGNLDRPVLFWQTNQRLYQEGVRVFVQVGCGTLA